MFASRNASFPAVLELTNLDRPTASSSAALVPVLLTLAYVGAQIGLFSIHEPWHDEAQAWLKARDLATLYDALFIPGEGHPPLWYWLLRGLSYVVTFDQARMLMLAVAALNAWLLARLFGDRPILLALLLCSLPILHTWGFHFRPYPLILSCVLGALLLARVRRFHAATWLMALTCGFSFLGGFLFGFWLLWRLHRGTPIVQLLAPALIAGLFGASAILSSLGNHDAGFQTGSLISAVIETMALPFAIPEVPAFIIVPIAAVLIGISLRHSPFALVAVAVLLLLFGLFGATVYGMREWHAAFGLMLVIMAVTVTRGPIWPLALLLLAQDYWGVKKAVQEIRFPASADEMGYRAVLADAGDRLVATNLVAWPDYVLTPSAARYGFQFVSGNNGRVVRSIDLRSRRHGDMSRQVFAESPSPYWLVCFQCEDPLALIRSAGRQATELMPPTEAQAGTLAAYRID